MKSNKYDCNEKDEPNKINDDSLSPPLENINSLVGNQAYLGPLRERVQSLDSILSEGADSRSTQWSKQPGRHEEGPIPTLYAVVSSQFHSRSPELTAASLLEELKAFSGRDVPQRISTHCSIELPPTVDSFPITTIQSSESLGQLVSFAPSLHKDAAPPTSLKRSIQKFEPDIETLAGSAMVAVKPPVTHHKLKHRLKSSDRSNLAASVIASTLSETQSHSSEGAVAPSSMAVRRSSGVTPSYVGDAMFPQSTSPSFKPRQISASTDPVMVDHITAATMNLRNRSETSEDEIRSESDELDEEGSRSSMYKSEKAYLGETITTDSTHLTKPTDTILPQRASSTAEIEFPKDESGLFRLPRKSRTPEDAWKKFSENIRKMGLLEHPSCSYLDRRPGGHGLRRRSLLQRLILQQADKHGKYVQWTPSMELAFTSCADTEIVEAAKILASVLVLRDMFHHSFPDLDSAAVYPAPTMPLGEGSTEPLFDPSRVALPPLCSAEYKMENGVYQVYWLSHMDSVSDPNIPLYKGQPLLSYSDPIPTVGRFLAALKQVMAAVQHPACKTFTFRRLEYLRNRFDLHIMFNAPAELQETKDNKHRDFYNVRKVDTHVHHSACMHQKHLLRFIRKKFRTEPDVVVARTAGGQPVTLREFFEQDIGISAWDASIDLLNVHALGSCFHRFDIFNTKYNPFGQATLREVFLKTDNLMGGRFLAELTKEVIEDMEEEKYQFVEWRVSIYGKNRSEWKKMAEWVKNFGLTSKNVRWIVQVPRLYHVYRKLNLVNNFGELLSNIFEPVFDAVKDPQAHPEIYYLLLQMNGWDSVDDESVVSKYTSEGGALPLPEDWVEPTNPPYSYWGYYMYSNIRSLNHLLTARGMRTLPFRPHCGEAGSISHLASMYLLADGINHGIMLRKSPVLQYLYYLLQIGLAVSPLSNNALFHEIGKNPFRQFFSVGLNLSLSTDDPLMFHFTDEPLLEEYSCCAHVWRLSPVDLCEIARNSILQSTCGMLFSHFEPQFKRHWLGENYNLGGRRGNSIFHSNVSNIRAQYREDVLLEELKYIRDVLQLQEILDELAP